MISVNAVKLTGMSNSSAMKTLRSAMNTKTFGPVEVTVIRSVTEIMNNVSELETFRQQKKLSDRAIDVGGSSERGLVDVPDGALVEAKEIATSHTLGKASQQGKMHLNSGTCYCKFCCFLCQIFIWVHWRVKVT